jgi:hypothetical protein
MRGRAGRLVFATFVFTLGGCSCGGEVPSTCSTSADCPAGRTCVDGRCTPIPDSGGSDSAVDAGGEDATTCPPERTCAAACCEGSDRCRLDRCVPDLGSCTTSDDCWFDSYCLDGDCIPYGVPPEHTRDESCTRSIDIDALVPEVQCRWTGPPAGDPSPNHFHVMSTPIVVDLDLDEDPDTLLPSIVFTTFPTSGSYSNPGVLRVIDGATCAHQVTIDPADQVMSPASTAAGDLDGDGRAEIVAAAHGGGLLSFAVGPGGTITRRHRSGTCDGAGGRVPDVTGGADRWSGPSIHDLDDDGRPEVIYGGTVYDRDLCLLSSSLGFPGYHKGVVPVVADVDEDGAMELVFGNGVHAWDAAGRTTVPEPYFTAAGLSHGQVAVADLGVFPLASMGGGDRAEVAVVSSGEVRVQTIEGTVVFGPFAIPGGGTGGPPTVADFDGDGRREIATAGGSRYVVFDLDCVPGGDAARCATGGTGGVLWTQPSQDASSNVTGSSVFDFDANGSAEAVYADECYLRIYDGATGNVLYSAARSSGTTYENPVIADVDGDFNTEIVSSVNDYAGTLGCAAEDPLRPGSTFATSHGIVVLRDELDRWAASRPIWSQHAYAVTHVGDRGEIPRSSAVAINWRDPDLNNFRQNVQGDLEALGAPDLTSTGEREPFRVECMGGRGDVEARVCNRGTLPVPAGTPIGFRLGAEDGMEVCRTALASTLAPGECETVVCSVPLDMDPADVYVVADPDAARDECYEGNNVALLRVACDRLE